jgi:hypothetical protein
MISDHLIRERQSTAGPVGAGHSLRNVVVLVDDLAGSSNPPAFKEHNRTAILWSPISK